MLNKQENLSSTEVCFHGQDTIQRYEHIFRDMFPSRPLTWAKFQKKCGHLVCCYVCLLSVWNGSLNAHKFSRATDTHVIFVLNERNWSTTTTKSTKSWNIIYLLLLYVYVFVVAMKPNGIHINELCWYIFLPTSITLCPWTYKRKYVNVAKVLKTFLWINQLFSFMSLILPDGVFHVKVNGLMLQTVCESMCRIITDLR